MIVSEKLEAEEAMTKLYSTAKRFSQRYISPLVLRQIYRLYCKWRSLVRNRNGWWDSRKDERSGSQAIVGSWDLRIRFVHCALSAGTLFLGALRRQQSGGPPARHTVRARRPPGQDLRLQPTVIRSQALADEAPRS
ncbi:hypothetical protein CEXT_78441 [Caerostris extrusa]|uniref:Uncharacterized protein n=1 Tax=Caerostris extrusa TaxID=172846 RepID=A0AAV4XKQ6_CAEEX|nr:hypothetical protein CEXT_78441 [Caerostris extrusa]